MPDSTYLELHDHIGVTADGNLEPLVAISPVPYLVPTLVQDPETGKDVVVETQETTTIEFAETLGKRPARMVPGTRIVESADPRITAFLLASNEGGVWREIDPPTKTEAKRAAKELTDAVEEAGTHTDPEEGQS